MGTTLTGTTPQDTYDSLIKVTDNGPLSGTAKYLSDGLGNDSALAVSTAAVGIGTNTPSDVLQVSKTQSATTRLQITNAQTGGSTTIRASLRVTANDRIGELVAVNGDVIYVGSSSNHNVALMANSGAVLFGTPAGNVGIGTSSPEAVASSTTLQVNGADHSLVRTGTSAFGGYLATIPIVGVTAISNARNPITGTYNNTGVAASVISLFSESANSYITFSTATANNSNPSERVRVTSNGLTFNGDTASANALDDYEEGTWTMGISFGGASVGVTYGNNTGKYTKIGRQVTVTGYVNLTSKGSSTGNVEITGLPFAQTGSIQNYSAAASYMVGVTFANQFTIIGLTGTTLAIYEISEAGPSSLITNADFNNDSEVLISYTYFV
jgi:hypothetical protein